jgi:hypothetical protein
MDLRGQLPALEEISHEALTAAMREVIRNQKSIAAPAKTRVTKQRKKGRQYE